MSDVYYVVGGVAYGILQFIISWVAGELDVDVDFDGDADFDIGDVVSFKGWTSIKQLLGYEITWIDWLIGFFIGLVFVFMLYHLYKFCMKLQNFPTYEPLVYLAGRPARIYVRLDDKRYLAFINISGASREAELVSISGTSYAVNQVVTIREVMDNTLYID